MKHRHKKGSATIETAAGALVLIPVLLTLIDIITLVVAQTINDDIAKQAARYAAQQSTSDAGKTIANDYILGQHSRYANNGSHVIDVLGNCVAFSWATDNSVVSVTTQVTCFLPISLPLVGITQQVFQASATEPIVGVQPTGQTSSN